MSDSPKHRGLCVGVWKVLAPFSYVDVIPSLVRCRHWCGRTLAWLRAEMLTDLYGMDPVYPNGLGDKW